MKMDTNRLELKQPDGTTIEVTRVDGMQVNVWKNGVLVREYKYARGADAQNIFYTICGVLIGLEQTT